MNDKINHPTHYTRGKIEVWDFILDQGLNYLLGNVCKYICRAGHKDDRLTDLKKARAYLDREIKRVELEQNTLVIESPTQLPLPLPIPYPVPSGTGTPYPDPSTVIIYKKDTK